MGEPQLWGNRLKTEATLNTAPSKLLHHKTNGVGGESSHNQLDTHPFLSNIVKRSYQINCVWRNTVWKKYFFDFLTLFLLFCLSGFEFTTYFDTTIMVLFSRMLLYIHNICGFIFTTYFDTTIMVLFSRMLLYINVI